MWWSVTLLVQLFECNNCLQNALHRSYFSAAAINIEIKKQCFCACMFLMVYLLRT